MPPREYIPFVPMVQVVPKGQVGCARIEHYTVSEADSRATLRSAAHRDFQDYVPAGQYCRLLVRDQLVMSDTLMERETNRELVQRAYGNVLVAGLGIGLVLVPLLFKDQVDHLVVVEREQDVIDLVAPHFSTTSPFWIETLKAYRLHRLKIVQGNVFTWRPEDVLGSGHRFNTIYFDIWPDKNLANLDDMQLLKRRYRPYLVKKHTGTQDCKPWIGCWSEDELRHYRKCNEIRAAMW